MNRPGFSGDVLVWVSRHRGGPLQGLMVLRFHLGGWSVAVAFQQAKACAYSSSRVDIDAAGSRIIVHD